MRDVLVLNNSKSNTMILHILSSSRYIRGITLMVSSDENSSELKISKIVALSQMYLPYFVNLGNISESLSVESCKGPSP